MAFFRTVLTFTGYGALGSVGTLAFLGRNSKVLPLSTSDYLYNTTFYARYNPENNPTTSDVCIRKVPLSKIRPEYLEKYGKLVERFCAGVWSGIGKSSPTQYANDGRVVRALLQEWKG